MFYNLAIKSQCRSHPVPLSCDFTSEFLVVQLLLPLLSLPSLAVAFLSYSFGALPPVDFASPCFPHTR